MSQIRAGAGEARIIFPEEMFPTEGEHYTGIHDDPVAHVVCFADGQEQGAEKYVIVQLNLVSYFDTDGVKELVSGLTGAKKEHILVHCTHNLATPHCFGREADKKYIEIYSNAVNQALQKAAEAAKETLRPAEISFGTAVSNVNVSRVIPYGEGLWQGTNEAGVTDHTVPVIRIDDENGACIALLYAVNMAPGVLEGSYLEDGGRLVTGDVAGTSEVYIKRVFPDAVCCYCLGASSDQWQALRAVPDFVSGKGERVTEDLHETGFVYADALGRKLAAAVTQTALACETETVDSIQMETREYTYPGQKEIGRVFHLMKPGKVDFEPAEDVVSDATVLMLGNIGIVAGHAEINVSTLQEIREKTKCERVFFMSFTDGAGGYMAAKDNYDGWGYQCRKSSFARGSAELFAANMADFLDDMMEKR